MAEQNVTWEPAGPQTRGTEETESRRSPRTDHRRMSPKDMTHLCYRCKKIKPFSEFYPSAIRKKDFMCKQCRKDYMAEYKGQHPERVRAWARGRMRKWREKNSELSQERSREENFKRREKVNSYSREYAKTNLEKKRAQQQANRAVKKGVLIPQPCEICGNPKAEKHHDDYSKPLEVRWLCPKCHRRLHRWVA